MNEPLNDEEITGMKKYYENCMEPKPDVFALLATIDQLKGDFNNYKEWAKNCCVLLEKERDELKEENAKLKETHEYEIERGRD